MSHKDNVKQEVTEMHYDPVTPANNIFKNVRDLIKYGDMENCPYSHPQDISKAYNILNKTGKLLESIKAWNCLPPVHKPWIAFKTHFCETQIEITNTG